MKFKELTKCPFCGGEEFYETGYASGPTSFTMRFDGNGTEADNANMYDSLGFKFTGRCYCKKCGQYLGNIEKDNISKKAEKAIKGSNK